MSQLLPAVFTPEPALALALALVRTALMFGLVGLGVTLRDSQRLWPLALGLVAVYLTALAYSALGGLDIFVGRLAHPYMTANTLGLAGTFGVWLALFLSGPLLWRLPLGLAALATLLASGSRGALLAVLVGCGVGWAVKSSRRMVLGLLLGVGLLLGGLYAGRTLGIDAVQRLASADTTGRDIVWNDTLSVIRAYPLAGVGSYRLGQFLAPPGEACNFFTGTDGGAVKCPLILEKIGSPWLIAHNAALQQLAETGPLGFAGLLCLLGAALTGAISRRSALSCAVLAGLIVATVTDNTLLVPSPFFGEIFWIVVGLELLHITNPHWRMGWVAAGLGLFLALPFAEALRVPVTQPGPLKVLQFLSAPTQAKAGEPYQVVARFELPRAEYRVSLRSCLTTCVTIQTLRLDMRVSSAPVLTLKGLLRAVPEQRLELWLLPGESSFQIRPLGVTTWTVRGVPGGQP